jgi:hypothetical protein
MNISTDKKTGAVLAGELEGRLQKVEAAIEAISNNGISIANANANISSDQNQSNPLNENTIIRYHVPAGSKGQINIYDQAGKIIRVLNASGHSELNTYALTAGTYTYTLLINNKVALSKQLVIIKSVTNHQLN